MIYYIKRFYKPMIDLHSHILPGIDDGPRTLDESIEMCMAAHSDGIKTMLATPHFNPPLYKTSQATVSELTGTLNQALKKQGIGLQVLQGAEVVISPDIIKWVKTEGHLTINKGRYIIIEFPPDVVPPNWQGFLSNIQKNGLIPIIAHPERNPWFSANPDALCEPVRNGAMVQITAMSVTGGFGKEVRTFSKYLLKNNLAHIIASDAHSADLRPACLSEAVRRASQLIGEQKALSLVIDTPSAIIGNTIIPQPC
ncbi:MAG: tyrosine protein phosphatase [Deltaproteobacteria bacterium]|nr:tyrosine protein phosphatase [Deltaproteobacteria bacterium]